MDMYAVAQTCWLQGPHDARRSSWRGKLLDGIAQSHASPLDSVIDAEVFVNLHLTIGPLVSLVAGVLILAVPRLLNYIVAIYLIIIGVLGLFGTTGMHLG
jgi:hypothetical protein